MTRVGLLLAISQIVVLSVHGYQDLGCYIDESDRDLTERVERSWISPSKCNQLCTGKKFRFFGLQASSECWCGQVFGKYGPIAKQQCNKKCSSSDDNNAMCGSDWRNSLYASDFMDNEENLGMRFRGCYADADNRDLPVLILKADYMTLHICHAHCMEKRFAYFGVQSGHECFCGNSYGRYGERNVDECRNDCRGDRSQYCGGGWRNSVYSIVYEPTEVKESMDLEVRNELTVLIKTIFEGFPYGAVCDTCLISKWNKRVADMKFRVFAVKDIASVLSSYSEKIREKVLRLQHGPYAKITFEDFDFEIVDNLGVRKLIAGVAKRVNDKVELWILSGDLTAYLVPKHNTYVSGGRFITEKRGYQATELTMIDKGMRYETYKLLEKKLESFK